MGTVKEIASYPFYKKSLLVMAGAIILSLPLITTQIALRSTPQLPAQATIPEAPCEFCKSACQSDGNCPAGMVCKSVECHSCFSETGPCEDECMLVLGVTTQNIPPEGCPPGLVCQAVWVQECNDFVNRCVSGALPPPTATPSAMNHVPQITTTRFPDGTMGMPYQTAVQAIDYNGEDILTMNVTNLPPGLSFHRSTCITSHTNNLARLTCKISGYFAPNTNTRAPYRVGIYVSDNRGGSDQKYLDLRVRPTGGTGEPPASPPPSEPTAPWWRQLWKDLFK